SPFGLGTAGGVGAIALGDLNGDARPDVLATIGSGTANNDALVALAGDGTGALAAAAPVTVATGQLSGVALADLDGDGDLDALADVDADGDLDGLVLDGSAPLVTLLRNDGAGGLTPTGVAVPGLTAGSGLTTGELNGDGALDLVVTDAAGDAVGVLRGDGTGA